MLKKIFLSLCFVLAGIGAANAQATKKKTAAAAPAMTYVGAICIDVATGAVFSEDNADATAQPASLTKLMTLLLVLERIDSGQLKLTDTVTISRTVAREAMRSDSSSVWLAQGETFPVDELLYALMLRSANDSAVALAEKISGSREAFVQLMNARAAQLGMSRTVYTSPNGLPVSGIAPDTSTARDIATLCRELLKHRDTLRYTSTKERMFRPTAADGKGRTNLVNHNKLLWNNTACDGLKTGYTSAAGASIATTASRGGKRVIAVVLGCKGTSTARQTQRMREEKASEWMTAAFVKLGVATAPITTYNPNAPVAMASDPAPARAMPVPATSAPAPAAPAPRKPDVDLSTLFKF